MRDLNDAGILDLITGRLLLGYVRVSTGEQDLSNQGAELHAAGCTRIFSEKITGTRRDRPELARMLDHLRAGDVVTVTRLDRLARSTRDLLNIAASMQAVGAGLRSLGEPWRSGEQLKLEAALGNTLTTIVRFLRCSGSSRFRHFSHFQVAVQHGYPNLNEQVCPLIGPVHLPLFCAPQAYDFIDCRFGDTAADRHAAPIPPSIVDKVFAIGFQVPKRPAKIPPQR